MKKIITFFTVICLIFINNVASATNATEVTKKKLRFFNVDVHISVIADLKNIFEEMGHKIESKNLSAHTWVFGKEKDSLKVINENNWYNTTPQMADEFYKEYKDYLNQFDGFIVTHAAQFALLYEKFDKPIIIVNSTRYSSFSIDDKDRLNQLNEYLKNGAENNKIFIISNNKGDQQYLKYYTGIDSELIPSLCLYTDAKYTGNTKGFITKGGGELNLKKNFKNPKLIRNKKLKKQYKWQDLYNFQGIIHFPYNISTMSIFEQYSANVPLFFPSKEFLLELHYKYPKEILSQLSFLQVMNKPSSDIINNPDNTNDQNVLKQWIDAADFYDQNNMPYIKYFNSLQELEYMLQNTDLKLISSSMSKHNQKRKELVFKKWESILEKVNKYINN